MNGGRSPDGRQPRDRHPRRRRRGRHAADRRAESALVPAATVLATPAPADAPLSPAEVAEMKQHLAFLRAYKDALRLKLNAAEDLLVNGQREPTVRGVCRHLLGKLDHTAVEHAVAREPFRSDAAARSRLLAGALRVTPDVGLLLAWLETLSEVRSRAEAAAAFAEVVRRIDFASLAPSKLARLLQVLAQTFGEQERVQVLFSLLALPAFAAAFDAAADALPPAVAATCAPLRAVHRRLAGEEPPPDVAGGGSSPVLAEGVARVLDAPDSVLRAYPEALRTVLVQLALGPAVPEPLADRAVRVLLPTLPSAGRTYAALALRRAAQLLRARVDDRARSLLAALQRAQPGQRTAARWLAALDAPRLGRVALVGGGGDAAAGLAPALWLDGQRPVWVRIAPPDAATRLAAEAALQAELALPGVACVVEQGLAPAGAYVAVAAPGRPFEPAADPPDAAETLALLAALGRVLHAVAIAGAVLPDAAPARFLVDRRAGSVVLANAGGLVRAPSEVARAAHAAMVAGLVAQLLPAAVREQLSSDGDPVLAAVARTGADLTQLVAGLDRAAQLASVLSEARPRGD